MVPRDYDRIQDAIDAAVAGDQVKVLAGIYSEIVTMKAGVDLLGEGADVTTIVALAEGPPTAVVTTADSSADAAALCQAIFVSGSLEGPDIFRKMARAEAVLLVRTDGGAPYLVASASLLGRIELAPELETEIGGDVRYLLPPDSF